MGLDLRRPLPGPHVGEVGGGRSHNRKQGYGQKREGKFLWKEVAASSFKPWVLTASAVFFPQSQREVDGSKGCWGPLPGGGQERTQGRIREWWF